MKFKFIFSQLCLLFSLLFVGCNDASPPTTRPNEIGDWHNLTLIDAIGSEIEEAYKIKTHPYSIGEEVPFARIELLLSDPNFDHQSLAGKVAMFESVKAFKSKLQLVFRYPEDDSVMPTLWIKYDAKTGEEIKP